ncbi:MAG: hypothetical protein ACR2MQ_14190 [Gemmatimonadaceae bacterium]
MKPFYAHEDVGSQGDCRLLVISYFFPPDAAVGARRWEKLCHYAAERGWGVDVITRSAPELLPTHPRLRELPSGVRVYSVAAPEPAVARVLKKTEERVSKLVRERKISRSVASTARGSVPGQFQTLPSSIARADVRWALGTPRGLLRLYWTFLDYTGGSAWSSAAVEAAAAIFRRGVHRAVVATSPPYLVQEGARQIGRRWGIPFVLDMRDPWSHVERLIEAAATPLWLHLAARYESRAVAEAALVIANTELARRQLVATYPRRASDIITVTNGADEESLPPQRVGGRFVIAHAGTLYLDRDPRALFVAAGRVIREFGLTPGEFGLSFIGELEAVGGFPIHEVARQEGISEYVETGPPLPHAAALAFMSQATMLVTMSGTNMAAVPAKTFECIRFPAWVLALSAPGSATELLLEGTEADVVAPSDADGIAAAIRGRYLAHRGGAIPAPIGESQPRFSRRFQANVLFDALDARVGCRTRDPQLAVAPAQQPRSVQRRQVAS